MSERIRFVALLLIVLPALGACAGAPVKRSESFNARKALAQEMVRRGDWPRAFRLVDGLHREDPKDAEVVAMRGVIYREQRLLKEAEADLVEALGLKPGYAFAHSSLAILYDQQGKGEAIDHHFRAAELEPLNPGYLNNLAFSLFTHGRAQDAISFYHEALRLDPTNSRIRNNLGFAYAKVGDFARAAEHFTMGGSRAEAKNNLGYAYQAVNDLGHAFDLYVEALRLDPGLAKARENLFEVSKQLGKTIPSDLRLAPRS